MPNYHSRMAEVLDDDERSRLAALIERKGHIRQKIRSLLPSYYLADGFMERAEREGGEKTLRMLASTLTKAALLDVLRGELLAYEECALYELDTASSSTYSTNLHSLILFRDAFLTIGIMCRTGLDGAMQASQEDELVTVSSVDTLLCFWSGAGGFLRTLKAPHIDFDTPITKDLLCRPKEDVAIEEGLQVFLSGGRAAYAYTHIGEPVVVLFMELNKLKSPVVARYRAKSGVFHSVSAADKVSSRLQVLASQLKAFSPSGFDIHGALRPLLKHRDHFVRWSALREIIADDPANAVPVVDKCLEHETHPQVIKAANAAKAGMG